MSRLIRMIWFWGWIGFVCLAVTMGDLTFIMSSNNIQAQTLEEQRDRMPVSTNIDTTFEVDMVVSKPVVQAGDLITFTVQLRALERPQVIELHNTLPVSLTDITLLTRGSSYDYQRHMLSYRSIVMPDRPSMLVYRGQVHNGVIPGTILESSVEVRSGDQVVSRSISVAVPDHDSVPTALVPMVVAVDNDLSVEGLRLLNRAEVAAANPNLTVLVWLDGPEEGDSYLYRLQADDDPACPNYINPTCDGRYRWGETIWSMPERVADPLSIAEFLKGALLAYPNANQVIPVFVGHGSGISANGLAAQPSRKPRQSSPDQLAGMLLDNHPEGTSLSTRSLSEALQWSLQGAQRAGSQRTRYDGVFLDACLMGMVEVAYELKDSADLLLSAESIKWASFPYQQHLEVFANTFDTSAVMQQWLQTEVSQVQADSGHPYTYALVDLRQIDSVRVALDNLAQALIATLPAGREAIDRAFLAADCFDSNGDGQIEPGVDNYCDLGTFAHRLAEQFADNPEVVQAAATLQAMLAEAVILEQSQDGVPWLYSSQAWTWTPELSGLSLYMPLLQDEWKRGFYTGNQFLLAEDGQWDEFLMAYWQGAPPEPAPCPPECGEPQPPLPTNPNPTTSANTTTVQPEIQSAPLPTTTTPPKRRRILP